jgi:hypothetical protein
MEQQINHVKIAQKLIIKWIILIILGVFLFGLGLFLGRSGFTIPVQSPSIIESH